MSEWKKVKLGEVITLQRGYDLPKAKFKNGNIPVITSTSIMGYHNVAKEKGPGVITGRSGTIGQVQYVESEYWPHNTSLFVKDFKGNLPKFIYYFLKDFDPSRAMTGSAVPTLNRNNLAILDVRIPPLATQHRIATILSRYDSLIENYQKQIKLLEEAAQRLYKEWFIDLHFPGHEKSNIIDGVPEGWEKTTINDVTSKITTGLNPRKNFVLGNGENYYVTIKNMANNTIYLDDKCDKVDDDAIEKINKRSDLKTGDILFSGIGTIGRVCLIDVPTNNWNVSESVFTLRTNDVVSKEFMYLMLLSSDVQNYCQAHAHGAAQRGIRMADLKAYKFSLAPKKIMQDFTCKVIPYIENVSRIQSQLRLLTEARDRLLPKLMSGEIEV